MGHAHAEWTWGEGQGNMEQCQARKGFGPRSAVLIVLGSAAGAKGMGRCAMEGDNRWPRGCAQQWPVTARHTRQVTGQVAGQVLVSSAAARFPDAGSES